MPHLLPYRDFVGLQLAGDVSRLVVAIAVSLSTHAVVMFSQLPAHHLGSSLYNPGTLEVSMVAAPQAPARQPEPAPLPKPTISMVAAQTGHTVTEAMEEPTPVTQSKPQPAVEPRQELHARMESSRASSAQQAPALPSLAPEPLFAPQPDYPEEARWEERTGSALLKFHIRADGSVEDITLLSSSGHADLDHSAMRTLQQWRFSPEPGSGQRWYQHRFRFRLL